MSSPISRGSAINFHTLMDNVPDTFPFLWGEHLLQKGLAGIIAETDSGKTTLALELCLAIAKGESTFLSIPLNPRRRAALFVSTEDDLDLLGIRMKRFQSTQSLIVNKTPIAFDLMSGSSERTIQSIKDALPEHGVDLIVVDAFGDLLMDDPNNAAQVRQILTAYQSLAAELDCVILFIHHVRKTAGAVPSKADALGSTAFQAKLRTLVGVSMNLDRSIEIKLLKGNYSSADAKDLIITVNNDAHGIRYLNMISARERRASNHQAQLDVLAEVLQRLGADHPKAMILKEARRFGYNRGRSSFYNDLALIQASEEIAEVSIAE